MIIIEGPDGSGKTTLVHELSLRLGLPIAGKVVDHNTNAMLDLKRWVDNNLAGGFQRMIFDRHRLISEPIYGIALRWRESTHSDFWDDQAWLYNAMTTFRAIRPVIIVCLPPLEVVKNNIADDPKNEAVRSDTWAIYRGYQTVLARGEADQVYDYTQTSEATIRSFESLIIRRMFTRH